MAVLSFQNVGKSFGSTQVLNGLTFSVGAGELLVLLGPNGAGKSTTMSMVTGLERPSSGRVELLGFAPDSMAARRQFAFVPQDSYMPAHATGRQVLDFMRAHYPLGHTVDDVIERFGLQNLLERQVGHLSGGQRRLIALAGAFLSGAPFLILDEPTVGLDMEVRHRLYEELRRYTAGGGTVLMTTHYLAEAEELASRVIVLHQGKAVFSGTPADIKSRFGFKRVSFRSKLQPPDGLAGCLLRKNDIWCVDSSRSDEVLKKLMAWGEAREIEVVPLPLEEIFLTESEKGGAWI